MYNIIAQQHQQQHLVDVAQELATNVLATGLLVVEDTRRGGLWQDSKFNVYDNNSTKVRTRMMIPKPRAGSNKLTQFSI